MKKAIQDQVLEFHEAMNLPIGTHVEIPSDERVRLRIRLVTEEFCEFLRSVLNDNQAVDQNLTLDEVIGMLLVATEDAPLRVDVVEMTDALADLDYVVEGTRLEFGIDGEPIAEEVHRSNMAKVGGPMRADGKIGKPPGWTPPDIAGELRKQGNKE